MDAAQWAKDVRNDGSYNQVQDKKVKPEHEHALNCPRCNSTNTKFCYYNNYSLTQPRYFCKACKRYWTKGGTLRSVPVGGGSRKNKRSSVSSSSSTSSMSRPIDLSQFSSQSFNTHEAHQDLNLGSQEEYHHGFSRFLKLPKIENANNNNNNNNNNASFLSSHFTSNGLDSRIIGTTTTDPANVNSMFNGARFNLQDFKPTMMSYSFQGNNGIKYGNLEGNNQEDGERVMLPFGVVNQQQHPPRDHLGQSMGQANSNAYWNGTMGEAGSSTLYN